MATVANGGSRRFQSVMPPKRRFGTGQYGTRFKAEKRRPPKVVLKRPTPGIESRGKLGGGRSKTGWYIPEGGDVPALKHVSEEFRENLTPESRTALMNVPTKVGKSPLWYAQIPGQALAGLLAGRGLNLGLPDAAYALTGDIGIHPDMMEPGREEDLEGLMQHELIHAWDANQMAGMRDRGETLTGLPGILDYPRQFMMRGPGGEAMAGADISEDLEGIMKSRYSGWLSAPEKYTMMAQTMGFDPAKIPEEYQHLYSGLFNQESFVRPPPPEPLKIEDLLEAQRRGMSIEEYLKIK